MNDELLDRMIEQWEEDAEEMKQYGYTGELVSVAIQAYIVELEYVRENGEMIDAGTNTPRFPESLKDDFDE